MAEPFAKDRSISPIYYIPIITIIGNSNDVIRLCIVLVWPYYLVHQFRSRSLFLGILGVPDLLLRAQSSRYAANILSNLSEDSFSFSI